MRTALFWIFSTAAVGSALGVVGSLRSPINSALSLVVSMLALAGLYVLLEAQFVGLIQVMVYAGAIVVLFLFVIMLLNLRGSGAAGAESQPITKAIGALVAVARAHARVGARALAGRRRGLRHDARDRRGALHRLRARGAGRRRAPARRDRGRGRARQEEDRVMGDLLGFHFQIVAALIFAIGALGVLLRRNIIVMFMSIELMLNGANLSLVAFSREIGNDQGQILAFMVMVVAAVEVAVGLAIIISLVRNRDTVNIEDASQMKW
jgi:NADH-quinone oxidoreductase subunit K